MARLLWKLGKAGAVVGVPIYCYTAGKNAVENHHQDFTVLTQESHKTGLVGLFRFKGSPPCAKVEAYLDYHGSPYTTVDVNPMFKEALYFSKDYKLVPIAIIKGQQVNDSRDILANLSGGLSAHEDKLMTMLDKEVVPAAEMLMFESPTNSTLLFEHSSSLFEKHILPYLTPALAYSLKRKLGAAADADLFKPCLNKLFKEMGSPGRNPGVTELALFGVLRNMHALPDVQDALKEAGRADWYKNLVEQAEKRSKLRALTA
eukprot:TRINITY_DN2090_c0_g1_i1.p1 TRINITY_DN2090_c0_g1~~TRINITY_DN2090_c0_g1_i1.p1  ORF type:complete len:280 (+),score=116.50 TRINITY_DN2090_c0_g1_i1:63-842(+)